MTNATMSRREADLSKLNGCTALYQRNPAAPRNFDTVTSFTSLHRSACNRIIKDFPAGCWPHADMIWPTQTFETSKRLAVTAAARPAQAAAGRARLLRRRLHAMVPLRNTGGGAVHLVLGAAEADAVHAAVELRLALGAALHAAAAVWRCPQVLGACTCTAGRRCRGGAIIRLSALSPLRWTRQWAR